MRTLVSYPLNNSIIERNHFYVVGHCEYPVKEIWFQVYYCEDPNNHILVLNERKLNPEELRLHVSPYSISKDGTYGVRIKAEDYEWTELTYFNVKAEQGWETITQIPNVNSNPETLKDRCAVSNLSYLDNQLVFTIFGNKLQDNNGTLFHIDKETFKVLQKDVIPNDILNKSKFFFWKNKLFKLTINDKIIIKDYDFIGLYGWGLFYMTERIVENDYFCFVNADHHLVIIYKDRFRPHPNEIRILIINERGISKEFVYLNDMMDYEMFILKDIIHVGNIGGKEIIIVPCKVTDNDKKRVVMIKFKLSYDVFDLYENTINEYIDYPSGLINPIHIFPYGRIYWNNKNKKDDSIESWDVITLKKNRVIPYGGICNLKNNVDGRLYSIGTKSEFPGMMYLKRYIE